MVVTCEAATSARGRSRPPPHAARPTVAAIATAKVAGRRMFAKALMSVLGILQVSWLYNACTPRSKANGPAAHTVSSA